MTKKPPPEPPAVLWSLVSGPQTGIPHWYRVFGGPLPDVQAELVTRTEFAAERGYGSRFALTERGVDGRCPIPGGSK